MRDDVKFVQFCVDASTGSMVAILRVGRIQVKREIVRIVIRIYREGYEASEIKNGQLCIIGAHASHSWPRVVD